MGDVPKTMRAVLIKDGKGPIENLYIGETEVPTCGASQVLVQIKAFGLNRVDLLQRDGLPPPPGASTIMGVEFSGVVVACGESVHRWKGGAEVVGLASGGAYAEYIAVEATNIFEKPEKLSWVEAAGVPEAFLTAFQALVLIANIKQGENVLIHAGASGVGLAAIQLARVFGAHSVTATSSSPTKLAWLHSLPLGPTHTADYTTQDFARVVKDAVPGGKGADVVVDFVGPSHWNRNLDAMAPEGRMVLLGMLSGTKAEHADLAPMLYKRLRIEGSTLRSRSTAYQAELIRRFVLEAADKITGENGEGPMRVYVHKTYPLTAIQDAHREMKENKNSGKIIVVVEGY